jgi:hypothetical protein
MRWAGEDDKWVQYFKSESLKGGDDLEDRHVGIILKQILITWDVDRAVQAQNA